MSRQGRRSRSGEPAATEVPTDLYKEALHALDENIILRKQLHGLTQRDNAGGTMEDDHQGRSLSESLHRGGSLHTITTHRNVRTFRP
jgi:hypothetical protein